MTGIIATLLVYASLYIVRPLTVFVHELGHAIPALLLTKEKVEMYIGSHGDPSQSNIFTISRLTIYFKFNPVLWDRGLCVQNDPHMSIRDQILFVIAGPLTSLIFGLTAFYICFYVADSGRMRVLGIFLLFSG